MAEIYDLAIVGTGPAGVSAALTAKARGLNFIWFGSKDLSIKIEKAEEIHNYPGLCAVTGGQMQEAFLKQLQTEEISVTEKTIHQIFRMGKNYALFAGQEGWTAKTILLAVGTTTAGTIPGEQEYLGKGVSYCATCDGRLYQGRTIAVICNNPKYEEEVRFLAKLAEKVYVYASYPDFGMNAATVEVRQNPAKEIIGEQLVTGIRERKTDEVIPVSGVFCLKDAYSPATLLKDIEMENNHIKVDRSMRTSLPGCYAAGDCTGRPYQYAKAVGEGNVAVHSILEYLHENEEKE